MSPWSYLDLSFDYLLRDSLPVFEVITNSQKFWSVSRCNNLTSRVCSQPQYCLVPYRAHDLPAVPETLDL